MTPVKEGAELSPKPTMPADNPKPNITNPTKIPIKGRFLKSTMSEKNPPDLKRHEVRTVRVPKRPSKGAEKMMPKVKKGRAQILGGTPS